MVAVNQKGVGWQEILRATLEERERGRARKSPLNNDGRVNRCRIWEWKSTHCACEGHWLVRRLARASPPRTSSRSPRYSSWVEAARLSRAVVFSGASLQTLMNKLVLEGMGCRRRERRPNTRKEMRTKPRPAPTQRTRWEGSPEERVTAGITDWVWAQEGIVGGNRVGRRRMGWKKGLRAEREHRPPVSWSACAVLQHRQPEPGCGKDG
ncbi:hypothetical protein DFH09DRAFT_1282594 [Mycena vulgaris]|nr:hypothetical protein DFH09DRAFT_1291507 [Mycena vulgaris]KAJ6542328.1 hypothetical protein DFH09DRAFT_1282594 [Mycena vulgaris]